MSLSQMACLKKSQLVTRPINVGIQCNLMHLKYRVHRAFRPAMKRSIPHSIWRPEKPVASTCITVISWCSEALGLAGS